MKTKKFVWDDTKPPIVYRPGTSDEAIIQTVLVEAKEYMFPNPQTLGDPKIVFDMGGNIGVLAVILSSCYPDARIYSFEPVKENFDLLLENTKEYKNVQACNYGLGNDTGRRTIWASEDPVNYGGFSLEIKNESRPHYLITIRDIASVVKEFGVPDIIKVDVEGAESEIFESMPNLDRVKWIAGELHGIRDFQLLNLLSRHFKIQCARNFGDKVWHFHAANKSLPIWS